MLMGCLRRSHVSSLSIIFPRAQLLVSWFLPLFKHGSPLGMSFKINVDAAVGPRFSSIAAMARDRRGELVFAGSMKVNTTLPLLAEAEAIKWALSLVPAMGNDCIIVESDCQYCVNLLNDLAEPPPWRFWSLCSELRLPLSVLDKVFVKWVPRLCNTAAHTLAKWSLSCNFFGPFDFGNCPACFSSIILEVQEGVVALFLPSLI